MRTVLLTLSLLVAAYPAPAQTDDREAQEALRAADAWIVATGWLVDARDSLAAGDMRRPGTGVELMLDAMIANRRAVVALESGLVSLPSTDEFPLNPHAALAIPACSTTIEALIAVLDRGFVVFEKVMAATDRRELAPLIEETATVTAQVGETWQRWVASTLLLTYALVDMDRTTEGAFQHLRITSAQRRDLEQRIVERFPDAPRQREAGQDAVDSSIAAMREFLAGPHRSSDAP